MARKEVNSTTPVGPANEPDLNTLAQMGEDAASTDLVPASETGMVLGAVTGELSPGNIRLPRLQIAYGVGNLAEHFNPGDLVLGGDNLLVKKEQPLYLILLTVHQYWKEYLSKEQYAAKIRPRTFNTASEVHAAGGTTQWVNGVGPTFNTAMDLKMLIQQPEGVVCGLFGVPVGGELYAPAILSVDKTAYKRIGPMVLTTQQFSLRTRGLYSALFELSTTMEKVNGNPTVTPRLKLHKHLSDEAVNEIKALFGAVTAAPADQA